MAHPRFRRKKSPRPEKEGIVAAIETGAIANSRIGVPSAAQITAAATTRDPTQSSGYRTSISRATTEIILKSGTLRMKPLITKGLMRAAHRGRRECPT
jgi:hypothetical protein